MKKLLRGPLIMAAAVIIARVGSERLGGPAWLSNVLSAVALTCLIGPVYFAMKIAANPSLHPYSTQLKATAAYAVLVRAMILPTYWLANFYGWQDARFAVPPDGDPLQGYVVIPFAAAAFWIIASIIVGGGVGAVILKLMRSRR